MSDDPVLGRAGLKAERIAHLCVVVDYGYVTGRVDGRADFHETSLLPGDAVVGRRWQSTTLSNQRDRAEPSFNTVSTPPGVPSSA